MNQHRPKLLFVDADRRPGIETMLDSIISWMVKPERPYYCALLEGHDAASTLRGWVMNHDSELALQNTRLLVAYDRIGGGFTGFAGRQLGRRRETDLVDLVNRAERPRCPRLRSRLKDLMPLFAPVGPNDFYLSKFGISPDMEGEELRPALLDECIERANHGGFDRIRTDIDAENDEIRRLFDDRGFEVFDRGHARRANITYLNMDLEL